MNRLKHKKLVINGKFVPQRTCVCCRAVLPKSELIRVARLSDGNVLVDCDNIAGGRGAYVCKNEDCINRLYKSGGLSRSLKTRVSEEIYKECADIGE